MKKILLASFCLFATASFAQELFPELAGLGKNSQQQIESEEKASEAAPSAETDLFGEEITLENQQNNNLDEEVTEEQITEEQITDQTQDNQTTSDANAKDVDETQNAEENEEEEEEDEEEKVVRIYMAKADATITPNDNFSYCFGEIRFINELKNPVRDLEITITYAPYSNTYVVQNLIKGQERSVPVTLIGKACEHILDMPQIEIERCVIEDIDEATCKSKILFVPLNAS